MCWQSPIPCILCFVCPNNGQQFVTFQELARCLVGEEERATPNVVMNETLLSLFLTKIFYGIWPEDIAHQALGWWFSESVKLSDVVQGVKIGGETAVNTEELFVHDCCQWQSTEGVHACFIDSFRVFAFAWTWYICEAVLWIKVEVVNDVHSSLKVK